MNDRTTVAIIGIIVWLVLFWNYPLITICTAISASCNDYLENTK